jgi:hypothetical protein
MPDVGSVVAACADVASALANVAAAVAEIRAMANVHAVAQICAVANVHATVANMACSVAKMKGPMASETQHNRGQREQRAECKAGEKDVFHGPVWLVVYSSSGRVSMECTDARGN